MPDPSVSSQAETSHSERPEGAPKAPKLGAKVALPDVGSEKMVGSPSLEEHPMARNVEAPRTEGWAPWPIGLRVAEEEKKKEDEERRKLDGEEEKKEKMGEGEEEKKEKEESEKKRVSPSLGQLEEEVPAFLPGVDPRSALLCSLSLSLFLTPPSRCRLVLDIASSSSRVDMPMPPKRLCWRPVR